MAIDLVKIDLVKGSCFIQGRFVSLGQTRPEHIPVGSSNSQAATVKKKGSCFEQTKLIII